MAETAVGLVVDRLIPLLSEEAKLLRGVHKQVDEINRELLYIQAFLKDADQRAGADGDGSVVKLWVKELREATEKIEDAIDEYIQDIAERRANQQEPNSLRRRFVCFLRKVSCFIVKLKPRHEIASKIRDLKKQVVEINGRSKNYNLVPLDQTNCPTRKWPDPRDDATFLKETEVVGVQSDKKDLVARLEAPEHGVIALVGMGGIGKTTLAHQVFEEAKRKFDCRAWVTMSESYKRLELLKTLIRKFCESKEESVPQDMDQEGYELKLMKKIRDYLQGKSYLVVFDDVWDKNFLKHFKNGFPVESGKIVLTTRERDMNMSSNVHIHNMKFLNPESLLELFYNKAFHLEKEKARQSDFVDLSRKIVERCEGLPLAIVVLGGLLATKDKREWEELLTHLSSELERNEDLASINKILSLSYNDLPYNLKYCFLYLGIFPEDSSIRSHRLVRQWIAEGFVKPAGGKTLEDVAKQHLAELINRSMVIVSRIDDKGGVRDCRIHDLVREFILTNMKDFNICKVVSEGDSCDFKSLTARRVSYFSGSHGAPKSYDIPKTEMNKLCKLRHLLAYQDNDLNRTGVKIQKGFGNLKELQKLYTVEANVEGVNVVEEVSKLRELRKLGIKKLRSEDGRILCECIQGLKFLESLEVFSVSEDEVIECESISSPPQRLQHLSLHGRLTKFPEWIGKLENLVRIILKWSKLEEDPLKSLCHLPNLLQMTIRDDAYYGEKVEFEKRAFPKLKKLSLWDFSRLNSLIIEEGALPNLETLEIIGCPQLKEFSIEEGALPNLETFEIIACLQLKEKPYLSKLKRLRPDERRYFSSMLKVNSI